MAGPLVHPSKIAGLPERVQELVNSLMPKELNNLRSSISPYDIIHSHAWHVLIFDCQNHFGLLKLLIELKTLIYELVFATESGIILHPGTFTEKGISYPILPTSLLVASREVYKGARGILYRSATCKLLVNPQRPRTLDTFIAGKRSWKG
jgi:hypothetical protein